MALGRYGMLVYGPRSLAELARSRLVRPNALVMT